MCIINCVQSDASCWTSVADAAMWLLFGFGIGVLLGMRVQRRGNKSSVTTHASGNGATGSGVEIYAGNLAYDLTESDLREAFGKYGAVSDVRIITNKFNNKSKGYGFVRMPNQTEADAAIKALHGKNFKGREIVANEAKSKSKNNER